MELRLTFESRTSRHLAREDKKGEKPENVFRRIESLRAETHEPNQRVLFYNRERCPAHRFAFSRLVPRVRRCFELPSG
jgi:hypothetical protein